MSISISEEEARAKFNKDLVIDLTEDEVRAGFRTEAAFDNLLQVIIWRSMVAKYRRDCGGLFKARDYTCRFELPEDPAEEAGKIEAILREAYRYGTTHSVRPNTVIHIEK